MRLEIADDLAGAFVGAGRATVGRFRDGDDEGAAIQQVDQLFAQCDGLRAGFPGMQDFLPGLFVVAGDGAEVEIDARRDDQMVVGEIAAAVGLYRPFFRVDRSYRGVYHLDAPVFLQAVEAVDQGIELAVAGQYLVGGRAGDEFLVALDEDDLDAAVAPLAQVLGCGGAAEAGADDDDAADFPALFRSGERAAGKQRGAGQGGGCAEGLEQAAAVVVDQ